LRDRDREKLMGERSHKHCTPHILSCANSLTKTFLQVEVSVHTLLVMQGKQVLDEAVIGLLGSTYFFEVRN